MEDRNFIFLPVASVNNGTVVFKQNGLYNIFDNPKINLNPVSIHCVVAESLEKSANIVTKIADHLLAENRELNGRLNNGYFSSSLENITSSPPLPGDHLLIFQEHVLAKKSVQQDEPTAHFFLLLSPNANMGNFSVKALFGVACALASDVVFSFDGIPTDETISWMKDILCSAFQSKIVEQLQNVYILANCWSAGSQFSLGYQKNTAFYDAVIASRFPQEFQKMGIKFARNLDVFQNYAGTNVTSKAHSASERLFQRLVAERSSIKLLDGKEALCSTLAACLQVVEDYQPDYEDSMVFDMLRPQSNCDDPEESDGDLSEQNMLSGNLSEEEREEAEELSFTFTDKLPWIDNTEPELLKTLEGQNRSLGACPQKVLELAINDGLPNTEPQSKDIHENQCPAESQETEEESAEELLTRIFQRSSTHIVRDPIRRVQLPSTTVGIDQAEGFKPQFNCEEKEPNRSHEVGRKKNRSTTTSVEEEVKHKSVQDHQNKVISIVTQVFLNAPLSAATTLPLIFDQIKQMTAKEGITLQRLGLDYFIQEAFQTIQCLQEELHNLIESEGASCIQDETLLNLVRKHESDYMERSKSPIEIKTSVKEKIAEVVKIYMQICKDTHQTEQDTLFKAISELKSRAREIIFETSSEKPEERRWNVASLTTSLVIVLEKAYEGKVHSWMRKEIAEFENAVQIMWNFYISQDEKAKRQEISTASLSKQTHEFTTMAPSYNSCNGNQINLVTHKGKKSLETLRQPAQEELGPFSNIHFTPSFSPKIQTAFDPILAEPPRVAIVFNWETLEVFVKRKEIMESIFKMNPNQLYDYRGKHGNCISNPTNNCKLHDLAALFLCFEKGNWLYRILSYFVYSPQDLKGKHVVEAISCSLSLLGENIKRCLDTTDFTAVMTIPPFSCRHLAMAFRKAVETSGFKIEVISHFGPCLVSIENIVNLNKRKTYALVAYTSALVQYTVSAIFLMDEGRITRLAFHQSKHKQNEKHGISEIACAVNVKLVEMAIIIAKDGQSSGVSQQIHDHFPYVSRIQVAQVEDLASSMLNFNTTRKDSFTKKVQELVGLNNMENKMMSACIHYDVNWKGTD